MAENFVEYITRDGDRWDLIAHAHYGNALDFERIVKANPHVTYSTRLTGGLRLRVPVIDEASGLVDADLPPWKRAGA